jgi:prophage regulatory protein
VTTTNNRAAGGSTPAALPFNQKQKTDDHMKAHLHRVIRLRDLPDYVGLKRTQIDALIIRGEFPRPIKLNESGRAKGWLEHELVAWQQERIAARDAN